MGKKSVKTKIHKLKKKVKLNKKKKAPKKPQDSSQDSSQIIQNIKDTRSVREQLLQRLNQGGGYMPPGYSQSPTDRMIRQTEMTAIENKKQQEDVNLFRQKFNEELKKRKEINKEVKQMKLDMKHLQRGEAKADSQLIERDHLKKTNEELKTDIEKKKKEAELDPLKKEKAEQEAERNRLRSEKKALKTEQQKNVLGVEVTTLKDKNEKTAKQIEALRALQESKAYSNSTEAYKEEYKRERELAQQLELAEKADKLARENAAKKFEHDTAMKDEDYQKVYAEQQNQMKNLNTAAFNLENDMYQNKINEKRLKQSQENIMQQTLRNDKLIDENNKLEAISESIKDSNIFEKEAELIKTNARVQRHNTYVKNRLEKEDQIIKDSLEVINKDAQIEFMKSPAAIEETQKLVQLGTQQAMITEQMKLKELEAEEAKKLNEVIIQAGVQQQAQNSGMPEDAALHIQANMITDGIQSKSEERQSKYQIMEEIKGLAANSGLWDEYRRVRGGITPNDSNYMYMPTHSLHFIAKDFEQFINSKKQPMITFEADDDNDFL